MLDKWDTRLVVMTTLVSCWSKDPRGQNGALLVSPDRRQVTWGYNGFPRGLNDQMLYNKGTDQAKDELTVHAELNAIFNAAVDVTGWTIYVTKHPCAECAAAIIQKGIKRVVCPAPDFGRWRASQLIAQQVFHDTGIRVEHASFHLEVAAE